MGAVRKDYGYRDQNYNRSSKLEILKREIAINLGGKKSEELRQILEELSVEYTEEKYLEQQ